MMPFSKAKICTLVLSALLLFGGCLERRELKDRTIIEAIGIDRIEDEYRITMERFEPNPNVKDQEDKGTSDVVTAQGRSISEALEKVTHRHGSEVFLGNSTFVVLGRETAEQGISPVLNFFNAEDSISASIDMVISSSTAEDILDGECAASVLKVHEIIHEGKRTGIIGQSSLMDVMKRLYSDGASPYIPVIQKEAGEEKLTVSGTAIFQGDKMKDIISAEQTKGLLWATNEIERALIVVKDEELGTVSVEVQNNHTSVKPTIVDGIPHFDVRIRCVGMLEEVMRSDGGGITKKGIQTVQQLTENEIQRITMHSIKKAFTESRCDVFRFSDFLKKDELHYWKSIRKDWVDVIADCEFSYDVQCKIIKSGQESRYRSSAAGKKE